MQDNEPVPDATATEQQRTTEERKLIRNLERMEGRKLTDQEINLSLDQARGMKKLKIVPSRSPGSLIA